MNHALWLDPSFSTRVCLALLHSFWQIGLLAAFAWGFDRMPRRSVNWSYAIHLAALLTGLVALPITFLCVGVPVEGHIAASRPHEVDTASLPQIGDMTPSMAGAAHQPSTAIDPPAMASPGGSSQDWRQATTWCVWAYALGVLLMLSRVAHALWHAHRDLATAQRLQDGSLVASLKTLARQCSLRITPSLAIAEQVIVPQVVGLLRPVILLPASATTGLSTEDLRMILAHELAHIRRHDLWINLLQRLAETVLFFNPALWYLTRRTSRLREFCCDEFACRLLSADGACPRARYASALVRVAELSRPPAADSSRLATLAAMGRSPSELRRRIAHLLGEPIREPLRLSPSGGLVLLAGVVLAVAGSFLRPSGSDSADAQQPLQARQAAQSSQATDDGPSQTEEATRGTDTQLMEISGVCTTADGQPVDNAEVRLYHRELPSFEEALLHTLRTDSRGRYQFRNIRYPSPAQRQLNSEPYALAVKAEGYGSLIRFIPIRFGTDVTMDFSLNPAATLQGTLTDPDSKPIANADVWIQGIGLGPLEGILSCRSDADGHFAIPDAESWNAGDTSEAPDHFVRAGTQTLLGAHFFRVRHPEYGTQIGQFARAPSTVDLTLNRGAILEGRVIVADTGQPAAGVLVRACSQNGEPIGSDYVRTGDDGRYRFVLPESTYNLWVHHDGLTARAIEGVTAKSGVTVTAPDLQLIEGGLVEGQLVDADSGEPISLRGNDVAQIILRGPTRPASSGAKQVEPILADGSFRFRLPPGKSVLDLPHHSYGSFEFESITQNVLHIVEGETLKVRLNVKRVDHNDRSQ